MKKTLWLSLAFLTCSLSLAEQIPSTYMTLKWLVPAGTKSVWVKYTFWNQSNIVPATISWRSWILEVKKWQNMQNNVANIYQPIFEKNSWKSTFWPKRIINVIADEIKISDTKYFYDVSSKDSKWKLLFADSIAGGYFTKSCLNNFSTYWENWDISWKTDACLLIDQNNNILKIEKTSNIDTTLFEWEFWKQTTRCSQFGQVLNEKWEKIGSPICIKSLWETNISYQNWNIISSIKDQNYTYNFIYSKDWKLLAKLKYNKYESNIEANNQLYKVFMFSNNGSKTKFIWSDDEFKFWNWIYYSPYTFLYEKIDGKWILKKAWTLGLIEDKLYTSVDPKLWTLRWITTDINWNNISIWNDFFTQNFDILNWLWDIAFKPASENCGDMKNNIKIFRYNQNDITDIFSASNNVNDQYIIQWNFSTDWNVLVYNDKTLEANQPKTQWRWYFRYYISKTIWNLKSWANNYEIVLMSKDWNKKLCKTDISLITN